MSYIKKFLKLKKNKILIIFPFFFLIISCSGNQIVTSSTGTIIATTQSEKSVGDSLDDLSIKIGIKDRLFMYDASFVTKINVEVQLGKVLLTGKVKNQDQRVESVRLSWLQPGVNEVLNEIEIEEGFNLKEYAEDKLIKAQLITKVFADSQIRSLKYGVEVQNKVIYLMGITSNENELQRFIDHARSIKGVVDIISYVDIVTLDKNDS